MKMTIDETIEFFNGLECHTPQAKDARDVAVDTMHKYQQIFDKYEILCDSFAGLDGETISKKVDEFCIDTMRGIIGEHYAERI